LKRSFLLLIIAVICLSLISCGGGSKRGGRGNVGGNNGENVYIIRPDHPRVFITPDRVLRIQKDYDYQAAKNYVGRMLNRNSAEVNGYLAAEQCSTMIINICLLILAEPNETIYFENIKRSVNCLEVAKQWVNYILKNVPVSAGDDIPQRNRLLALAVAYDWLYSKYSAAEKKELADKMVEYLDYLDQQYRFFSKPKYVAGHSRRGNIIGFAAVLALYGEDERIKPYYDKIYYNWIGNPQGYQYVLDKVGRDGGHFMGWLYGASYSSPLFSMMWHSATGQLVGSQFYTDAPYFYIYGTDPFSFSVPDNNTPCTLPSFGDCWTLKPTGEIANIMAFSSSFCNNGYAEWYYQKYFKNYLHDGNREFRIISKTNNGAAGTVSPIGLPLARHFTGSGFAIARNTWNDVDNSSVYPTILIFKSMPYLIYNHDHLDQNSLTLNYKGPLLIDAGTYNDDYNSTYWKEYYTQTKAHNALLIDNKGQTATPRNEDTLSGPDGIKKVSRPSSQDGIWIKGNATEAYGSPVTSYLRNVMMAYKPKYLSHPVLLVVDRVKTDRYATPKLLWQVRKEPIIDTTNKYARVYNGWGGYARLEFFADKSISISTVADTYNRDDGKGNGIAGWGRIEVASSVTVNDIRFATLIVVKDQAVTTGVVPKARYIQKNDWIGVCVDKTLLIMADDTKGLTDITLSATEASGVQEIYVAGMKDGAAKIQLGSQLKTVTVIDGFGYLGF